MAFILIQKTAIEIKPRLGFIGNHGVDTFFIRAKEPEQSIIGNTDPNY
jgi:hypothetical protein